MTTKPTNPKDAVGIRKYPGSVIPRNVLGELGLAMLEGARKYGRHNYRAAGVKASVYFDAVSARHLDAWWEGEDIDPDSGLSHITKAIAGLVVLRDSMLRGNWVDDRPPRCAPGWQAELNRKAGEIIDRYPDALPAHTHADEVAALQTRIDQSVLAAFVVEGKIGPGGGGGAALSPEASAKNLIDFNQTPPVEGTVPGTSYVEPAAFVLPPRILVRDLTREHHGLNFRVVTCVPCGGLPSPEVGETVACRGVDPDGDAYFVREGSRCPAWLGPDSVLEFVP